MTRLVRLAAAAGLGACLAAPLAREARATPFSDVPANHWAYQYIQSLAADGVVDGYPDGKFKGDRPLTRYEMAVVVARVIARLQEAPPGSRGASKEDLDKLQKLIDSLKDELDSLGVRVANLEDSLDALDKRTAFAQSLSLHGVFLPNVTFRQRPNIPRTATNTTGAAVTTYYGATVPAGGAANPSAVAAVDPWINAFLSSDDSNNPLTSAGSGVQIRQDSRFSLAYAVTNDLTISLPVHVVNSEYGGEFTKDALVDIEPGVDVAIARAGAVSNLELTFGIVDAMTSSRLGLAFRQPQGYDGSIPYEYPLQPFQKGVAFKGTVGEGAFGLTDFEGSFTRVDQTLFDTQPGATDPTQIAAFVTDSYFYPVTPPQAGFTQTTAAGALQSNTFNAGNGALAQVFLNAKALDGSVYVSAFDGETFNGAGQPTGGPGALAAAPAFTYNEAYNDVVFGVPLPAGSSVTLTYRGLSETNNTNFQRYMAHARLNQKFKGYDGLEVGLNFNRVFDFDDTQTTGSGVTGLTTVFQSPASGNGAVSDTVLGLDFQAPLPFRVLGRGSNPVLFGELADSKFTPDYRNVAAVGDTASVFGTRFKVDKVELSAQYQSVGADFLDGAPFKYYGNAPSLFANYRATYFPDFFGFGNTLAINRQFDGQFGRVGLASPNTAGDPNLTTIYPVFNTLKASGPEFFSAFAPDSRGETLALDTPARIGDFSLSARASYRHLEEIRPNSSVFFGPQYAPTARLHYDTYTVGTRFKLPAFGQVATADLSGSYETLQRLDRTAFQYYPTDPGTQAASAGAFASAAAAFPTGGTYGSGSQVSYFPNYVNERHVVLTAVAALPVTRDLALGGSYTTQRYGGSYGTTQTQNISQRKDYYTGSITYSIPKTSSSVTFLARRYNYTDDVLPNFDFGQNRQDVNFTVRF